MRGLLASGARVYLWCEPVDMRKGFDGLSSLAMALVNMDPFSGHLFVFRSRRADYLKVLHWDGSGLCLFSKRLEKGKFVWPPLVKGSFSMTAAQLALLIEGMDWRRTHMPALGSLESRAPVML